MRSQPQLIEIFKTQYGSVCQCNASNLYLLEFSGEQTKFRAVNFIDFIKRVNQVNLAEMARNTSRQADLVILSPHYTDRCFVLRMQEIIHLKELLCGAKAMIQLNSIVRECLSQYAY